MAPQSDDWLDRCPRVPPGYRLQRTGGEALVVDAEGQRLARLNHAAAALWELCDGTTSIREMVEASERLFDAADERIGGDVRHVFLDLTGQRLIEAG